MSSLILIIKGVSAKSDRLLIKSRVESSYAKSSSPKADALSEFNVMSALRGTNSGASSEYDIMGITGKFACLAPKRAIRISAREENPSQIIRSTPSSARTSGSGPTCPC